MKLLLDTAAFLWLAMDSPRLSSKVRGLVASPDNRIYLSAVSAWEICVKHRLGRLELPAPPKQVIPATREAYAITSLDLVEEAALQESQLPALHRDPFDRMLICQAIIHGLALATPDEPLFEYPVQTIW